MTRLDRTALGLLDEAVEVEMRTPRRDGSISSRPIWIVVVEGDAYVRSYYGPGAAWYRRIRADGRAALGVAGSLIEVAGEPIDDDALDGRISAAFRAKYGRRSPGPTAGMVSPAAAATTLRLTRA